MTTPTLVRPTDTPQGNGGRPARRAIVRWAWRLVRRDWRQQALILALLTLSIAVAAAASSAVYNMPPPSNAELGTANHAVLLRQDDADPGLLARNLAVVRARFAATELITRRFAPIPGSTEQLELRGQDPQGPLGRPLLRLRDGRYPTAEGETAITDGWATAFDIGVGSDLQLEGLALQVVGIVENPLELFDEFGLVPPSEKDVASARILVRAPDDVFDEFGRNAPAGFGFQRPLRAAGADSAAIGALVLSTLVLLLVALVSAASFTVIAQRRMRQIGMLAAIGATEKHLRLVMVATGLVIGVVSALAGAVLGVALWVAGAPMLEPVAQHRIDPLNLPWSVLMALVVLGVATATAAAWMPARAAARIPVTAALMSRPPRSRQTHRSVVLAVVFVAAGLGCLIIGDEKQAIWMVAGIIATGLGVLFASPLAVRALKVVAPRTPVASRLAMRDLARYEARSGTALAAISLSLGMAVAIVVVTTAAGDTAQTGNLSDHQLFIRTPTDCPCVVAQHTAAEIAQFQTAVDAMLPGLDSATVVPLDVAVAAQSEESSAGQPVRPVVTVGRRISASSLRESGQLYVGTPQLLAYLRIDPAKVDPAADVLTSQTGELEYVGGAPSTPHEGSGPRKVEVPAPPPQFHSAPLATSLYTTPPRSVITTAALARLRWQSMRVGWLVESRQVLSAQQVATARAAAVRAGLIVEARRNQRGLETTRSGATAAGILLALAVLAMTVGLIRSEAAGDLRTLSATGASSRVRRSLTATTAAAMAVLGVVLGTTVAYLALIAAYRSDLSRLSRVPFLYLSLIAVGVPVLAYAAGWLFAARAPESLGRHALD